MLWSGCSAAIASGCVVVLAVCAVAESQDSSEDMLEAAYPPEAEAHDEGPITTVEKDGSGMYASAQEAIDAAPSHAIPCKELLQVLGFGGVQSVEFSPLGTKLAVYHGGVVSIFDAVTGRPVSGFEQGPLGVSEVRFSPHDKKLLTVRAWAESKEATLWDTSTGAELFRLDHSDGAITGISYSPDGTRILTEGWDGTIKLWDVDTAELLRVLSSDMDHVMDAAFSSDGAKVCARCFEGRRYWTGISQKALKVWEASSGRELISLSYALEDTHLVVLSSDFRKALALRDDAKHEAVLWDVEAGVELRSFAHEDGTRITCMAFSPNGALIVTAAEKLKRKEYWASNVVTLWDAATGEVVRTISEDTGLVFGVGFLCGGQGVVTKSYTEGHAVFYRLWDASTGKQLRGADYILYLAFSPDGRRVFSGHKEPAKLWDALSREKLVTLAGKPSDVKSAAISPDGTLIAVGSPLNTITVYDTSTGERMYTLGGTGHGDTVKLVAFSPDDTTLMTVSELQGVRLWDVGTGKTIQTINPSHLDTEGAGTVYAAFSPDGKTVLTGSDKGTDLWDASTAEKLRSFGAVEKPLFSFDGTQVLTGSWKGKAELWNTSTGEKLRTYAQANDHFSCVALSRDGSRVLTGSWDGTVTLWDAATGEILHSFSLDTKSPNGVRSLAFSPDDTRILAGTWNAPAKMWDAVSGKELATFPGTKFRIVQFSPDGNRVLTGGFVGPPKLWDGKTGEELAVLEGHDGNAFKAVFTPDSAMVLIWTSEKGKATLWEVATGKMLRSPTILAPGLASAAFSRDGKKLLIGTGSGRVFLWASGL